MRMGDASHVAQSYLRILCLAPDIVDDYVDSTPTDERAASRDDLLDWRRRRRLPEIAYETSRSRTDTTAWTK